MNNNEPHNRQKIKLHYICIKKGDELLFEIGRQIKSSSTFDLVIDGYQAIFDVDPDYDFDNHKLYLFGRALISLAADQNYMIDITSLLPLVDKIFYSESLDNIFYTFFTFLINSGCADKIAFFVLNEQLLKLRGVIFAEKRDQDIFFDNLSIKNITIDLKDKGKIADILFFERIEYVDLTEVTSDKLNTFFKSNVIAAGVYNKKGPCGAILVQSDAYSTHDFSYIHIFAKLLSLAIEFSRLNKQLTLAHEDIAYFKEYIDISSNLTQIGKITASVAHEIKNPLVSIGGFAKRLEKYVHNEKGLSYLKIIQQETTRLEKIVMDILTFSKVFILKKDMIDVYSLLHDLELFFQDKLTDKNISLMINHKSNIKAPIDEKKFRQVLINLIDNSICAIGSNGKISIDTYTDKNFLVILIKDTGDGFPQDFLSSPFQPFYTTKENGTGLGLSICQKIISAHGGHIQLGNHEKGAFVKIDIPL